MWFTDNPNNPDNPDLINLIEKLNPEQKQSVMANPNESALILAGAGSGKTRVLTTRIAWLLHNRLARVHNILAVTFTNKAAKEMHNRLGKLLENQYNVRGMWLGTFHGLCHRFLHQHYRVANLVQTFQVLDSSDQLSLIKRLLKQLNIDEKIVVPRSLQGFINAQKEAGLRAKYLINNINSNDIYTQRLIKCYEEYEKMCEREQVVDFAELLLRSYEILSEDTALRQHYQQRFTHILVDEFQDTNKLQYAWLKLLAGGGASVFAVGDDDQSIYRFRGANVGNMTDFIQDFGIHQPIKLEQNYRSVNYILQAANSVIQHNPNRLGKNLRTDAENGEPLRWFVAFNDYLEAEFIVNEIKLLQKDGWNLNEIACLYRSNAQSRVLEQILFQNQIPYKIYGGLRFYERQEIKHALAYLRLALNPNDDNALLRIINFPARGIGTRSIEQIQANAQLNGVSLYQSACEMGKKTANFIALIEQMREMIGVLSLVDIVKNVIEMSGLRSHYLNQSQIAERERVENLDELINAALFFKPEDNIFEEMPEDLAQSLAFPVIAFLSNAALESGENQAGNQDEAVQMMTIHAAKGLEFDAVFLSGLEEGRFPSELSLQEHEGLAEERRLMYVAITRARKRLYLSMAQQRFINGLMQYGVSSRFIDEIPEEVLLNLSSQNNSNYIKNNQNNIKNIKKQEFKFSQDAPNVSSKNLENLARDFHGFKIGDNIRHEKFGVGVITDALDNGASAKLTINFGKDGVKILDTAFAKLIKL